MSAGIPFKEVLSSNNALSSTAALLPASTRTTDHSLTCPTDDIHAFLLKNLLMRKLNHIDRHLWLAGQPTPPKPLNYQIASSREIVVDERIDMHLVWEHTRRLHLKPVPRCLLDADFWTTHLICNGSCCVAVRHEHPVQDMKPCTKELYQCALGFLYSYIALIQFESDFFIAHDHHLLPHDVTWEKWLSLTRQLLGHGVASPANINRRYLYGELRLSQLNKIYAFRYGSMLRGYQYTYQTYGEFFRDYLTPVTATTVYVALVLTAMQVGLATNHLRNSATFQNVSYGLTIFSILGPLIGILVVGLIGVSRFASNLLGTRKFKQERLDLYEEKAPCAQTA